MKKNIFKIVITAGFLAGSFASCTKKLDLLPTNDVTAAQVYNSPAGYKQAFAKVYGSFALTGNQGPAGNADLVVADEGNYLDFLRTFWYLQELPTDEAVLSWGDPGLPDFHNCNWSSSNPAITGLYYRAYYQITLCNDFINQSSDANLVSRGITGADADAIKLYRTEARFLRALQYWVIMDIYGSGPFITEKDIIGSGLPSQASRLDIFKYVETELKAIEPILVAPKANEYGRADQATAWSLLARIYLNAQVYTGTARWTDALTYSKKVIDAGYSLVPKYSQLMLADNNLNKNEFIFTINYDGLKTQGYGGTTFLTHAPIGGTMSPSDFGIKGGWVGLRTTKNLPALFPDVTGTLDSRSQFYTSGQNLEISDLTKFTDGYAVAKFKNVDRAGVAGQSLDFSDVDFPLFRLPEQYLIYAEATLRGATGADATLALTYINNLRTRAYGNTTGNIASGQLTTDFILDERARELYWEGFRRTDLIRYNKFVESTYLWPWKGGVKSGTAVDAYRKIYPIPSADISSNVKLVQNPGY
jgi:hypothetical protein